MSNVSEFLKELENLNSTDKVSVYIPSINDNVNFKQITALQHKNLLNSLSGGVLGQLKLQQFFTQILLENIENKAVELSLYDRQYVIVQLRRASVGDIIPINDKNYKLSTLPALKSTKFKFKYPTTRVIEHNGIVVNLAVPSLITESNVLDHLIINLSNKQLDDQKSQELIGTLLTYEIVKFIKSISIGDKVVDQSSCSIADLLAIVNNLPLKINNDIINYIADYRSYESNAFTFNDGVELTIDASFLTSA